MKKKIVIIDDDKKLCDLLITYLANYELDSVAFANPLEALKYINISNTDLIILDIMLPEMNGFDVCKEIRKGSEIPILMLTARGELTDKVVGLELGADDYLPKPFEPRELVARIQSIFRRVHKSEQNSVIKIDDLIVDLAKQTLQINGEDIEITTMEFGILVLLIKNHSRVVSRDQIMDKLKGMDWQAFDRSVDVLVSRLRQKINDDPKNPKYIKTIWGSGYKFIGRNE